MRPARRQHGFTLLEILVAFTVLALVGSALLQLFQGGLGNLAAGEGYSRAALLAESQLSRLRGEPALQEGRSEGELEPGYRYALALTPYVDQGDDRPGLLQADLTIHWGAPSDERQYAVRTLLLTDSPEAAR